MVMTKPTADPFVLVKPVNGRMPVSVSLQEDDSLYVDDGACMVQEEAAAGAFTSKEHVMITEILFHSIG